MNIIETVKQFRREYAKLPKPLGLVPTMGFLHEGHLTLVRRAREANASVVVSIFVNPTQFGPNEDFEAYPKSMEADLAMLEAEAVDVVFSPSVEEVYPHGMETYIDVGSVGERLEGGHRPGHFRGVATVVCKLLTIVRPDNVYFGQKDAQQCLVIKRMNTDLNLGAEVVVVPTVREPDGLAMSSRNVYLTPDERKSAPALYRSLLLARDLSAAGETDAEVIRLKMRTLILAESGGEIDYVSIADAETLEELTCIDRPALASLAVCFGKARLIDNIFL